MSEAEYTSWINETIPAYAKDKIQSGAWTEWESLEKSKAEFESLLPDGMKTKDNFLFSVVAEDGARVGMLWFAVKERATSRIAYVYNIEIESEHRRKGTRNKRFKRWRRKSRRWAWLAWPSMSSGTTSPHRRCMQSWVTCQPISTCTSLSARVPSPVEGPPSLASSIHVRCR